MFVKANGVEKGSVMNILHCLDGVLVASQVKNLEALMESLKVIINKLDDMIAKRCIEEGGDAGLRWGQGRWQRLDHKREEKADSSSS